MNSTPWDRQDDDVDVADQRTRQEVLDLYDRGVRDSQREEDELSGRTKTNSEFSTLQGESKKSETGDAQMDNTEEGSGGPPAPFVLESKPLPWNNTD